MEIRTEQLYRSLVENLPLVVYAWTLEPGSAAAGALVLTGQIEQMLEISPADSDPCRVHDLIHPDDRERIMAAHAEANASQRPLSLEYRVLTPSGRTIWVRDESRIVTDEEGVAHRHGYLVDVSVQRSAEVATTEALLREHTARLDVEAARAAIVSTINKISDGFYSFDTECRFRYVNAAGAALVGREIDELVGHSLWELFPAARTTELGRALLRAQAGEQVEIDDYRSPAIAGHTVEVRLFPSPDGVWLFVRDVTERRRLEDTLRQSQKMEAIGQLAGGIAHDFNNILTAVTGYADFALRDLESEPDLDSIRSEIEEIKRASNRATELTRQLLVFSRRQGLQRSTLDLNDIVTGTERFLRRLIGEHISIVITTKDGPALVEADGTQLEQVLVNLALNARDAMPDGGTLTVRTFDKAVGRDDAAALGVPAGAYVALSVEDTGVGIGDDLRAQIFAPFFTTKPAGEGTGLGLSTVHGIVHKSGGTIEVQSAPGAGSIFTVYLPAVAQAARPSTLPAQAALAGRGSERVLLVEDEAVLRDLISEMLSRKGYEVVTAPDAASAIARGEANDFDLLVTDVSMPGMSGVDLADALHRRSPGLGVLLISGYPRADLDASRLNSHIVFLAKPFSIEEVASAAREALDRRPRLL